jgi:hypothetical protein
MGVLRWLTRNLADTELATHADLKPIRLGHRRGEAFLLISYEIEGTDGKRYTIRATKRRRFRRTADDVTLRIISDKGETWLHATSSCRGLLGDLGRHRRNILELFDVLEKAGFAEKEKKRK